MADNSPSPDQALQFAIMLQAGLPAAEAILYFVEGEDPDYLAGELRKWQTSKNTKAAMLKLMRKPWQEMSLDERCRLGLDQHYSGLAYLLYSINYNEASVNEKMKLDTARQSIEARLAGMAGKTDALSQFFNDINTGKVTLAKPIPKWQA